MAECILSSFSVALCTCVYMRIEQLWLAPIAIPPLLLVLRDEGVLSGDLSMFAIVSPLIFTLIPFIIWRCCQTCGSIITTFTDLKDREPYVVHDCFSCTLTGSVDDLVGGWVPATVHSLRVPSGLSQ
jgi:hypothetical protein